MIRITFIAAFVWFFYPSLVEGQSNMQDKIESLRIAFITKELSLTSKESEQFWPVYNEYLAEKKALEETYKFGRVKMNVSDQEAEKLITRYFEREQKLLDLKKLYFQKLRGVLPLPKIARLNRVETAFKEALLERLKEFREKRNRRRKFQGN